MYNTFFPFSFDGSVGCRYHQSETDNNKDFSVSYIKKLKETQNTRRRSYKPVGKQRQVN